jgi:hypothetical protein
MTTASRFGAMQPYALALTGKIEKVRLRAEHG